MTEPTRPGIIIGDLLKEAGITQPEAALIMGVSRQHLSSVIRGISQDGLSPQMITRLATLFEDEEYWRKLSDDYCEYKKVVKDELVANERR